MTTAAELAAWEKELDEIEILESPAKFAQVISRHYSLPWLPYRWLTYVNDRLLKLVEKEGKNRLLLTAPPRHGKSDLCSVYFPAWYLNRYPDHRVILCAYGDDFAMEWGRKVRDLIEANPDKLRIRISGSSKAQDRWDIEGARGGMKTAGAGGQIVGRGANLLIIDDPIKDRDDAHSPGAREKKWEWWRTTVQSRLEPGAIVVMMHQRWHEDDLAGRVLLHEPERWDVVNFPALADEEDALGRKPGEPLCPERYDANALGAIRESMGASGFSALYQQRPQPEGGGIFRRENFRHWTQYGTEGHTYRLEDPVDGAILVPQDECWRFFTADLAVKAKETSDYTVIAVWDVAAWLKPSRLILRHLVRIRIEGAGHIDLLKKMADEWKPRFVGIEDAQQGFQTMALLQRQGVLTLPLRHKSKDKVFRAQDAATMMENRRIYFPSKADWLGQFEHELLVFPSGTYDDQVDTLAYAAEQTISGTNLAKKPKEKDPETLSERAWAQLRNKDKKSRDHPVLGRL